MTTLTHSTPFATPRRSGALLTKLLSRVQIARTRAALGKLEPHQLSDVGLTLHEAREEATRGFFDVPTNWNAPAHWR